MVLGVAAVGAVFFDLLASDGIVSAMQLALFVDMALVGFAFVMTLLLPGSASSAAQEATGAVATTRQPSQGLRAPGAPARQAYLPSET
jgi:hypothetical protein